MIKVLDEKINKIHFIGIGGISMSALAEIMLNEGCIVTGSDRSASKLTEKLKKKGATIYIGHSESNITDQQLVVYTAAIPKDNPEIQEAIRKNIPIMDRAEFLGLVMKNYKNSIAVSGTHGKTTTTSMISLILYRACLDPTIMIGGELDAIGGNLKIGNSEYFITEACEYKGSFLNFYPKIAIILNIDADHLDYYKDINEIYDTFIKFSKNISKDGVLIGYAEDERVKQILNSTSAKTLSYGINEGDIRATSIRFDSKGCAEFDVLKNNEIVGTIKLNVPGKHNILNSLAAICCALSLGIDFDIIKNSLYEFTGTHRRFEKKGVKKGITVIDDYAHHPTEIRATIQAAQNYPHKKLYCIFQPHTYTRTLTLFDEFSKAFNGVDKLILTDIYAAREKDLGLVNSKMLADAVERNGVDVVYIKDFDEIVKYIEENLSEGDVVITMGAGDVYKIGEEFLQR